MIERAVADPAIVGAALVGSTAAGGDRWSDLDLTFAVSPESSITDALDGWTEWAAQTFGAAKLFDLPIPGTIYRVFIFPGGLQVDLSFSEQGVFGKRGPHFELLFGEPVEHPRTVLDQSPADTFGWGVHHLIRAHVSIQRALPWQAEQWIHEARDSALTLACLRRGIEARHGKGFDKLPVDVTARFTEGLSRSIEFDELRRSLAVVTNGLLDEADGIVPTAPAVRTMLAQLVDCKSVRRDPSAIAEAIAMHQLREWLATRDRAASRARYRVADRDGAVNLMTRRHAQRRSHPFL